MTVTLLTQLGSWLESSTTKNLIIYSGVEASGVNEESGTSRWDPPVENLNCSNEGPLFYWAVPKVKINRNWFHRKIGYIIFLIICTVIEWKQLLPVKKLWEDLNSDVVCFEHLRYLSKPHYRVSRLTLHYHTTFTFTIYFIMTWWMNGFQFCTPTIYMCLPEYHNSLNNHN